jgi:hypothetical protein
MHFFEFKYTTIMFKPELYINSETDFQRMLLVIFCILV